MHKAMTWLMLILLLLTATACMTFNVIEKGGSKMPNKLLDGNYALFYKERTGSHEQPFLIRTITVPDYGPDIAFGVVTIENDHIKEGDVLTPIFGRTDFTPDFVLDLPGGAPSPEFAGTLTNGDRCWGTRQVTPGDKGWATPQG